MTLDRRRFLGAGAAALGAAAWPHPSHADAKDDPFGGFELGAQTYTFRKFRVERALKQMKELGLHYGEFYNDHIARASTPAQVKAALSLCKDYGVTPRA